MEFYFPLSLLSLSLEAWQLVDFYLSFLPAISILKCWNNDRAQVKECSLEKRRKENKSPAFIIRKNTKISRAIIIVIRANENLFGYTRTFTDTFTTLVLYG